MTARPARRWTSRPFLVSSLSGLLLLCLACGGGGGGGADFLESRTASYAIAAEASTGSDVGSFSSDLATAEAPATLAAAAGPNTERRVVVTTRLNILVQDPVKAEAEVQGWVREAGGFVSRTETERHGVRDGVWMILRVPMGAHDALSERLTGLGKRQSKTLDSEDVTEEWLDLEARLRAQKALEERLIGFLGKAQDTDDLLKVESELTRVRTTIERIEGRQRFLADRTAYCTIHLTLSMEPEVVAAAEAPTFTTRVSDTWSSSVSGLVSFGQNVVLAAIMLGPWLPLLFVGTFLFRRALRSNRRARPTRSARRLPRTTTTDAEPLTPEALSADESEAASPPEER